MTGAHARQEVRRQPRKEPSFAIRPRVVWLLFAALSSSCGGTQEAPPKVAVSSSLEVQRELREMEREWELRSQVARRELRPELEEFIERHGTDPSATRARIMLAQIALSERRYGAVEEILRPLLESGEGSARDEAMVILAAVDNRRGHHERALAKLSPLSGKLLSREARDQYSRERTSAAIESRKWRLTVDAMTEWLKESGSEDAHAKEWIQSAIVEVPPRALSRLLSDWPTKSSNKQEQMARDWVHRLVIGHLAQEALTSRDPRLARDLLRWSPPWLRASKSGDELAMLAALAQEEAQIRGRAVGVVLGGATLEERRRSVRVALGLRRGLRASARGKTSEAQNIQFLSAENRGSLGSALGMLSSLGASILVAGVNDEGALEALSFSEVRKVPVVVMNEPPELPPLSFGFVFGESTRTQIEAVYRDLGDGRKWMTVGTVAVPCSGVEARPTTITYPFHEWQQNGVEGILVLGDEGCASRLITQVRSVKWSPLVARGLESAHFEEELTRGTEELSAGSFPAPAQFRTGDQMSEFERTLAEGGAAPELLPRDWYFTLGFDLAKLVHAALSTLPETAATEKEEVMRRHELAKEALLSAQGSLISTEASGFGGKHRIARALHVSKPGATAPGGG